MTPIKTHTVIQRRFPLFRMLVPTVRQPAVGLEENGGSEVFFAVPPVGRAGGGAAGAEDAFVEAVELFAVCGGLAVLFALDGRDVLVH